MGRDRETGFMSLSLVYSFPDSYTTVFSAVYKPLNQKKIIYLCGLEEGAGAVSAAFLH